MRASARVAGQLDCLADFGGVFAEAEEFVDGEGFGGSAVGVGVLGEVPAGGDVLEVNFVRCGRGASRLVFPVQTGVDE